MSKILIDEATVKLVLEALEQCASYNCELERGAITALKALAEPPAQQEPKNGLRLQDIRVEMYPPQPTSGMVVGMSKGVRLIHTPTGTIVECDTERSQHRNREVALKKLEAALAEQPAQQQSCYCLNCEELSKQVTALKTCLEVERGFNLQERTAQQEPAFYRHEDGHLMTPYRAKFLCLDLNELQPLYTTPQPAQRKPLTEDEIYMHCPSWLSQEQCKTWVRQIEAAHGIKENI